MDGFGIIPIVDRFLERGGLRLQSGKRPLENKNQDRAISTVVEAFNALF
jgi:hypothetical protein